MLVSKIIVDVITSPHNYGPFTVTRAKTPKSPPPYATPR